jgi:subtilisin family serine protease
VRALAALALVVAALAAAPAALGGPGRIAVGVQDGVPTDQVALAVWDAVGEPIDRTLDPMRALIVPVDDVDAALPVLQALPGVAFVEPIVRNRTLAFAPNDPLAGLQWHLGAIHAFEYWPEPPASLNPVRVAVIDSGIDGGHPEFAGRIAEAKTFVGSQAEQDTIGHGTFVAGEIAAMTDNGEGVAGVGLSVQLLIGKVVRDDGSISLEAEAEAIQWAVDRGAQVINLSLGGKRAPNDPAQDTYSELEARAIDYAASRGVAVVAASGNCDDPCPYSFASYPAALSHVIGVGAMSVDRVVPDFSNRDPVFVDLVAPGVSIYSTFPRDLTDSACEHYGYSFCATLGEYREARGTSFAAPLVSAAAALALSLDPSLRPSQLARLLAQTADDLGPPGRDAGTGSGLLNVVRLLQAVVAPLPVADAFESNDDAGRRAATIPLRSGRTIDATIDAFDDPTDVYRIYLRRGTTLTASLTGDLGGKATLVLWQPDTQHVTPVTAVAARSGAIVTWKRGVKPVLRARIERSARYYLEVRSPPRGGGPYRLVLSVRRG